MLKKEKQKSEKKVACPLFLLTLKMHLTFLHVNILQLQNLYI